jgi:hypothetical protein
MMPFKLHPSWQAHTGHCQITYTTKNEHNQKIVYCLQDNGDKYGGIRLMRCTQDGEPSHEAKPKYLLNFERPPIEDSLTQKFNDWINKHEIDFKKGAV